MYGLKDKRITGAIAGTAVLVLVLIWAVFFWQMRNIRMISEDYQKEKLNSLVLKEKENKLSQLKKEIANIEEQNRKFDALFLKKDEALPFLRELEKAASTANCTVKVSPADISKIKFEKAKTPPKPADDDLTDDGTKSGGQPAPPKKDELAELKDYPAFTVEAVGTFSATTNFLIKTENLPYLVRILTLDAVPAGAKEKAAATSGALAAGAVQTPEAQSAGEKNVRLNFVAVVYGE